MKKIILSLITFVTMFVLSGCVGGTSTKGISPSGGKYTLWEQPNNEIFINPFSPSPTLKEELRIVAEFLKNKNKK